MAPVQRVALAARAPRVALAERRRALARWTRVSAEAAGSRRCVRLGKLYRRTSGARRLHDARQVRVDAGLQQVDDGERGDVRAFVQSSLAAGVGIGVGYFPVPADRRSSTPAPRAARRACACRQCGCGGCSRLERSACSLFPAVLSASCVVADYGRPAVAIGPYRARVGRRRFDQCSGAERWRTDATCARGRALSRQAVGGHASGTAKLLCCSRPTACRTTVLDDFRHRADRRGGRFGLSEHS